MLLRRVLKPESLQICKLAHTRLLQRSQNGLVCVLVAVCMLLPGVNVITVHVNDVPIAGADKLRRGSLLQLGKRHTNVLAEPRRPRDLALLHRPRG